MAAYFSALIRECIIVDESVTTEAIEAKLAEAGHKDVKRSTISRGDTIATLRVARSLGLLKGGRIRRPTAVSEPAETQETADTETA